MKKLMTSTIIVLPLLILAIMLVSGAIMSLITHIYVENVEFVQNDTLVLVMENESLPPSEQLLVNVFPLKADNRDVFYTVGDETIAAVDENGVVTAKFYGETYITVTSVENKAASAQRKLIITDKSVHKIVLGSEINTEMYEGETQKLSVSIYPQEAENRLIHWQSSDERILHVGENGVIQSVGAGKATVTAISDDNEQVTDSIEIMCYKQVTGVAFDKSVVVTSLDSSTFPEVKPVPSDAFVKIAYSSGDDKIASVDQTGKITFHKAGKVKIFVHATDFGGKIIDAAKEYISTNGYFIPPLFTVKDYSVDYDDYGTETPLPVEFTIAPDGAYRKVTSIVCDPADQLAFDESAMTFRFAKEMPVGKTYVDVIVHATVYDAETHDVTEKYEDKFRVNVSRDAKSVEASYNGTVASEIQTKLNRLTFTALKSAEATLVNVLVSPENHTNTIKYELIDGAEIAKIENGALSFSQEGTARVKISLLNAKGEETTSASITVTYMPLKPGDVSLDIDNTQEGTVETSLNFLGEEAKDMGVIYFTKPADTEVEYTVTKGSDVIKLVEPDGDGNYKIEPLKGGFAEVEIRVAEDSAAQILRVKGGEMVWKIEVYVDLPVKAEDFEIKFNGQTCANTFRTSLFKTEYTVTLTDRNGSTEGKQLFVTLPSGTEKISGLTYSSEVTFTSSDEIAFMFGVSYTDKVPESHRKEGVGLASVSRSVSSTRGKLDDMPTVKVGDQKIGSEEHLTFENIGKDIVLTVEGPYNPSDFVLKDNLPTIDGNECVTAKVSEDGATVTLTSKDVCKDKVMILTVGGKTFRLLVTSEAKADTISVVCCDQPLQDSVTYKTLLPQLTFTVTIGRKDEKELTDKEVEYSFDRQTWKVAELQDNKITLDINDGESTIYFRSHDQGVGIDLKFKKVLPEDFGLEVGYTLADGTEVVIEKIESVKNEKPHSYILPAVIQNRLLMKVILKEDFLGGIGSDENFKSLFKTTFEEEEGITIDHDAASSTIILTFKSQSFEKDLEIECGESSIILQLVRVNLASVELTGFDSKNDSDVYRGYQQVRVFAKHSDYDGKQVDYYKIPYLAVSDIESKTPVPPEHVYWEMKKVKDGEGETVLASQRGKVVTVGDKTYKIVPEDGVEGESAPETANETADGTTVTKNYVLKDQATGEIVSGKDGKNTENIPWVDVFSETGFARIYFGNFTGLSEVDVQNDYFGNFGEKPDWKKVEKQPDDQSGREFEPSEGAYSYLRVEAGDGAKESSVNAHFNFNVLDDNDLVNIFDANGYYSNKKIVLHNNLYGSKNTDVKSNEKYEVNNDFNKDEVGETPENKKLFLRNTANLNKDLIYGNGHAVSYNVMNEYLKSVNLPKNALGNSGGVSVRGAYNVTLRGRNATETFSENDTGVVFVFQYCYYSNIQHYYKCSPYGAKSGANNKGQEGDGGVSYFKNSVVNKAIKGIQLYYSGAKVYFENMMIYDCIMAVCAEGTGGSGSGEGHKLKAIFQGNFNDVLNYQTISSLTNAMNKTPIGGFLADTNAWRLAIAQYAEWFGKTGPGTMNDANADTRRFINPVVFACFYNTSGDRIDLIKRLSEVSVSGSNLTKAMDIYNNTFVLPAAGWTYSGDVTKDGGQSWKADGRDMSKLFTDDRDIRLLCEYLDVDEKTEKSVQNTDHIMWHMQKVYRDLSLIGERKSHIEDLKDSLKKAKAEGKWDGEWPDGSKLEDALNASAASTKAILPSKRKFEEKGV